MLKKIFKIYLRLDFGNAQQVSGVEGNVHWRQGRGGDSAQLVYFLKKNIFVCVMCKTSVVWDGVFKKVSVNDS